MGTFLPVCDRFQAMAGPDASAQSPNERLNQKENTVQKKHSNLARATDPLDKYNVVWHTPSKDHNGSMPIGNGEMGLNLWVEENGDLVFLVSRTDSWDEHERLCKIGRVRIQFAPSLTGGSFKQTLRLRQGEIEIIGGSGDSAIHVHVWVDANHQVAHVEADSQKDFWMQVMLEVWRDRERPFEKDEASGEGEDWGSHGFKEPKPIYPDTVMSGEKDCIVWYHRNRISPWKSTLELQHLQPAIEIGEDPLLHRTFGGIIKGDGLTTVDDRTLKTATPGKSFRVSIFTHTSVPATEAQWHNQIRQHIVEAEAVEINQARKAHRDWWADFWNRSWIRASGSEAAEIITRGYILQRFISACAGRGRFPIKFNGSIFTVNTRYDPDYRRWGGCYWFQNTRLPYWPMLASGDHEMMRPLFRMFEKAIPLAKIRSKIYFNHGGSYFPETMSFWGTYDNGGFGWGWDEGKPGRIGNSFIRYHYNGTLELLAMMIDYYRYTEDVEFLKKELLPVADEFLSWWEEHWERDSAGKLKMYPSQALETYWDVTNPAQDIAGLRWNLDNLLALTDEEIGAERRQRWSEFHKAVPELPMTIKDGKPALAPAEGKLGERHNSENPELYAIFPFRIYGVGKSDLELARHTFNVRAQTGNEGWRQDDTQAAFLGLAEIARDYVVDRAQKKHKDSRVPAFWGPNFDWIPDQSHGGNLMMALQTMLLQADDGKIRLLPAWPKDWNVEFKLHAPKNTIVEGTVHRGKLVELRITPEARKKDVVVMEDA